MLARKIIALSAALALMLGACSPAFRTKPNTPHTKGLFKTYSSGKKKGCGCH